MQPLYVLKLEETKSHSKCVASPRLATPSQHGVTSSDSFVGNRGRNLATPVAEPPYSQLPLPCLKVMLTKSLVYADMDLHYAS